jgi:glycerophosphoryl diester phosphodiesterase
VRFLRWTAGIVAILAAVYVYFATLHPREKVSRHTFFDSPGPWAIAHRGGRGLWPENTLFAFEQALTIGVDVLEMDLRATSDGVIVVLHDPTVDGTTNAIGRVDGMTLDEVQRLDAGFRFKNSSGQPTFRSRGIRVPALEEVLNRFEKARLNLEMKEFPPELAVKLCRLIEDKGATSRVLVASFEQRPMSAFRRACPSVATSATFLEAMAFYQLNRMNLASIYRSPAVALQLPGTFRKRRLIEPDLLELAGSINVRVQVWVVNDEAEMKRLLNIGVQGIVTDYPDRLLRLMGREAGRLPLPNR